MKLDKKTVTTLALLVAGGVILSWLLNHLEIVGTVLATAWGLIFPFVLGFVLAFLLNLPMCFVEKWVFRGRGGRWRRPASFGLTLVLVLAVLGLVVWLVIPQLVATVRMLGQEMPGYIKSAEVAIKPYLDYLPMLEEWVKALNLDWAKLMNQLSELLQSGAGNFLTGAVGVATSIISGTVSFFIGLVFAVYLLLSKEKLTAQFQGLLMAYIPQKRYEKLLDVAQLTYRTYAGFVSGQFTESMLCVFIYSAALAIGGFDYAMLIGVVIGFSSLIPIVGGFIGCIVGAFLLLISMGFWRALAFVILYIVLQQIESNTLYPMVVGNSVGLPPIWILVAVTVGGGLAGIIGILFFIPLFSVVYTLLHRDARARLEAKGIPSPVSQIPVPPPKKKRSRRAAAVSAGEQVSSPEAEPRPAKPEGAPPQGKKKKSGKK